jgi:hypothetical protein
VTSSECVSTSPNAVIDVHAELCLILRCIAMVHSFVHHDLSWRWKH